MVVVVVMVVVLVVSSSGDVEGVEVMVVLVGKCDSGKQLYKWKWKWRN